MTDLTDVHVPLLHAATLHREHVLSASGNYFYGSFMDFLVLVWQLLKVWTVTV